jgi:peptide/nickel transport system substrate-binding protein
LTTEYIGTGPFKVREYVRNSHLVIEANDRYVLGRPRIDEIEIKFLPDANALSANLLAGAVELTLGQNLGLEAAQQVANQWREGKLETSQAGGNPLTLFPQLINPQPAVLSDVRFRRALYHAIDRQEIVDSIMAGRAGIAHGILWKPGDREYPDIESSIVRYPYDPARAARLIEEIGYSKGADGFYQEPPGRASGGRLSVEVRTLSQTDSSVRALLPVADYWKRVGVDVETLVVPEQRTADREYRATRPGFDMTRIPPDITRFTSKETPLPENQFRGANRARYMNPDFDAAVDAYFMTIPWQERMRHLGRIVNMLTDEVIAITLFFEITPAMIGNRLENVRGGSRGTQVWNAQEWDVR